MTEEKEKKLEALRIHEKRGEPFTVVKAFHPDPTPTRSGMWREKANLPKTKRPIIYLDQ